MLDLMDKATADGKCPKCGRPVYPKADGGFTHDAPVQTIADVPEVRPKPMSKPRPAPAAEDPQGPEQPNQRA